MDLRTLVMKKLWMIFVIIGFAIMLIPIIEKTELENNNVEVLNRLNTLTAKELKENENQKGIFEFSKVENVDSLQVLTNNDDLKSCPIIGQLIISSLDMNLPILKGMETNNLYVGVGTMKNEQSMGKGNYAIAGHYIKNHDILFGRLLDIKKGDIVSITDKSTVYEYEVYETAVVLESEIEVLSDEKAVERGNPIITLMTCYYSSKTGKRFFAFGDLINQYAYSP